jgi:hypothetical protein
MMANKFYESDDPLVLRCLEAELERRAVDGYLTWHELWRRQQQSRDSSGGITTGRNNTGREGDPLQEMNVSSANEREATEVLHAEWPRLPSLNWTLYESLPHVPKRQ